MFLDEDLHESTAQLSTERSNCITAYYHLEYMLSIFDALLMVKYDTLSKWLSYSIVLAGISLATGFNPALVLAVLPICLSSLGDMFKSVIRYNRPVAQHYAMGTPEYKNAQIQFEVEKSEYTDEQAKILVSAESVGVSIPKLTDKLWLNQLTPAFNPESPLYKLANSKIFPILSWLIIAAATIEGLRAFNGYNLLSVIVSGSILAMLLGIQFKL
jgi:hypothetical protein